MRCWRALNMREIFSVPVVRGFRATTETQRHNAFVSFVSLWLLTGWYAGLRSFFDQKRRELVELQRLGAVQRGAAVGVGGIDIHAELHGQFDGLQREGFALGAVRLNPGGSAAHSG